MDPKKIVILVLLLIGLVVAGRWACEKWKFYNPPPSGQYYGYGYGYGKKGGKAGAPGQQPGQPGAPAATGAPAQP